MPASPGRQTGPFVRNFALSLSVRLTRPRLPSSCSIGAAVGSAAAASKDCDTLMASYLKCVRAKRGLTHVDECFDEGEKYRLCVAAEAVDRKASGQQRPKR